MESRLTLARPVRAPFLTGIAEAEVRIVVRKNGLEGTATGALHGTADGAARRSAQQMDGVHGVDAWDCEEPLNAKNHGVEASKNRTVVDVLLLWYCAAASC